MSGRTIVALLFKCIISFLFKGSLTLCKCMKTVFRSAGLQLLLHRRQWLCTITSWLRQYDIGNNSLSVIVLCLFVDALGFWHVHQEPCGYISQPCVLVLHEQTTVRFHRVHVVYVLPWGEIPSLPTCCKYRPRPEIFVHVSLLHVVCKSVWIGLVIIIV